MGPAGDETALHQGQSIALGQGPVEGDSGAAAFHGAVMDKDLLLSLVFYQEIFQLAFGRLGGTQNDTEIGLLHLPVLDFLVHDPQGLGVLGGNDDAAGVPVDAVAQGGSKGVLPIGGPLLLLIKVGLDVGDEGVDPLVFVRMDHHAGALVQEHQVFIFVDDVQLRLEDRQEGVFRGRGLKKLVIDIKLEQVPLLEAGVPLGTLAVGQGGSCSATGPVSGRHHFARW